VVPVCMCGDTQPQGRAVVRGCQSPAAVVLFRGPPSPLLAPGRSRQRPGPPPPLSIPCQLCTFPCTFLHHTHWSPRPPSLSLSADDPAERERGPLLTQHTVKMETAHYGVQVAQVRPNISVSSLVARTGRVTHTAQP
jgi:hypothetical protein